MVTYLLELQVSAHLEQKIPTGMLTVREEQLFFPLTSNRRSLLNSKTFSQTFCNPEYLESGLLTYGFQLAKTGRRFLTLGCLILKACA